jgi:MFS family permease
MRDRLRKVLINGNYARLWYGQAVSTTGDFVFDTTLALWVATVLAKEPNGHYAAWAPVATSGVYAATIAAMVIVGPLAGVFVDRWDRKRTMMRTETIRVALVAALFAMAFVPRHDLPIGVWLAVIYLVVFLLNAAGSFFDPARGATISVVVPGDADRARAVGIGQATTATASIIGPPIAAPLLFVAGFQWALLVNAASFVVSYLAIRSVQVSAPPAEKAPGSRFRSEFAEGLRFFFRSRLLVALVALAVTAQLGTGAMNSLDVFFVTRNLHASPKYYGLLATATGIGAIIGGLSGGAVVRRIGARSLTCLGAITGGLLVLLYARQTVLLAGLLAAGLLVIPFTMLNTGLIPLIYKATPQQYMGRVMAVLMPASMLSSMLSAAAAGALASTALRNFHATVIGIHMGTFDVIFSVSGLIIIVAGLVTLFVLPRDDDAASAESPDGAPTM